LENFGHSMASAAYLYRPSTTGQIAEVFELRQRNARDASGVTTHATPPERQRIVIVCGA
jgi:hypothetical protein